MFELEDRKQLAELIVELIEEPNGEMAGILLMLVAINQSDDIRKICDFHATVLTRTSDLVTDKIARLVRAAGSRSALATREAAIVAQGGT